jgi:quercetin dioxygenase-like cupin family protein
MRCERGGTDVLMLLDPGEVFEHAHLDPSITELISGEVELTVDGAPMLLVPGVEVRIPADAPHVLVNKGSSVAGVKCVHIHVTT